jgi:hypothetical protein
MIKEFKIATPNKPVHSTIFFQETGFNLFTKDDGFFYVSGCDSQEQANAAIAAHNPPAPTEPTVEEKLASVGLSVDDLKSALGI